jgi:hypothetical protein
MFEKQKLSPLELSYPSMEYPAAPSEMVNRAVELSGCQEPHNLLALREEAIAIGARVEQHAFNPIAIAKAATNRSLCARDDI